MNKVEKERNLALELFGQIENVDEVKKKSVLQNSESYVTEGEYSSESEPEEDNTDLFVIDKKKEDASNVVEEIKPTFHHQHHIPNTSVKEKSLWHDSDDEQENVDLNSSKELQNLKVSHAERYISGAEFNKRLRDKSKGVKQVFSSSHFSKKRKLQPRNKLTRLLQTTDALFDKENQVAHKVKYEVYSQLNIKFASSISFNSNGLLAAIYDNKQLSFYKNICDKNSFIDYANNKILTKELPFAVSHCVFVNENILIGINYYGFKFVKYDLRSDSLTVHPKIFGHQKSKDTKYLKIIPNETSWDKFCIITNSEIVVCENAILRSSGSIPQKAVHVTFVGADKLAVLNKRNQITLWSVNGTCSAIQLLSSRVDEASVGSCLLAYGNGNMACGQELGVLNLYKVSNNQIEFSRAYLNLRTPVQQISINESGTLLAYTAQEERGIRVVNLRNGKVLSNFPGKSRFTIPSGYIRGLGWAKNTNGKEVLAIVGLHTVSLCSFSL
eukprot:maker-scaffold_27-snap-gene-3.0-mRNA-1 protein AED:0.00 eAED:0.00 QI:59/1/1/1/1/1/2/369/497